jgi:hypothetical protein
MDEPEEHLEQLIDGAAKLLDLPVAPEFRPGIRANLATARRMAEILEAVAVDDEAEPAPVFTA